MSARAEYLEWRRSAGVGCVFARFLSRNPNDYGQKIIEASRSQNPERIAKAIASWTDRCVTDQSISIATLLLPTIDSVEGMARVALALKDLPKWLVTSSKLVPPPSRDLVCLHIFREVPFEVTSSRRSEVLGFGPFEIFPRTRRAPVPSFELLVGEPMAIDPISQEPTDRANVAHADLSDTAIPKVPGLFDKMVQQSRVLRLRSLGGADDRRAKAKVSFVIPSALARKLGLAP